MIKSENLKETKEKSKTVVPKEGQTEVISFLQFLEEALQMKISKEENNG